MARKIRVNTVRKIKKKKRNKRPVNNNQTPARAHGTTKKYRRIAPQSKPEISRQFLKYYEWYCCEITRTNQFINSYNLLMIETFKKPSRITQMSRS